MAGNPEYSGKMKKRRYVRKPYERFSTAHASTSNKSSAWNENAEVDSYQDANPNDNSLLRQMTNSVTGLFSKSWKISNWFRSKKNDDTTDVQPSSSSSYEQEEVISTYPEGESFIFAKTHKRSPNFKQIYPEEGGDEDVPVSSVKPSNISLKGRPRFGTNALDFPAPESRTFPSAKSCHAVAASTPAPSTSKDYFSDRHKNILEENDDGESLPELEDVSVIAHPGNDNTTYKDDLDLDESSTSKFSVSSPIQRGLGGRPPMADRKRLRESYDGLGGKDASNEIEADQEDSSSNTPQNLPQTSALASKRPRFNFTAYSSPFMNNSSFLDSSNSQFYPGKTMYGGASNFKRRHTPSRAQVRVQNYSHTPEDAGLSSAAKRILDSLNRMSTPLSDAKRMPSSRPKVDLFTSSYVADFHRYRPKLKSIPSTKLLTPIKASVKENLSQLMKSDVADTQSVKAAEDPEKTTTEATKSTPTTTVPMFTFTPCAAAAPVFKSTTASTKQTYTIEADVQLSTRNEGKQPRDSFKMKTSRKATDEALEEFVVDPCLPNVSLPISSLPKIDFSSITKGTSILSKTTDDDELFTFATPSVLAASSVEVSCDDYSSNSDFIFSQPGLETVAESHEKTKESEISVESSHNSNLPNISQITPRTEMKSDSIIPSATTTTFSSNWGDKFKPSKDSWECSECMVRNKSTESSCVACQSLKPGNKSVASSISTPVPSIITGTPVPTVTSGFGDFFKKPKNEWACDVCMISNRNEQTKCIACETPKPGSGVGSSQAEAFSEPTNGAFKFKSNTNSFKFGLSKEAVSTKSQNIAPTFKFGLSDSDTTTESAPAVDTPSFNFGVAASEPITKSTSMEPKFNFGVSKPAEDLVKSVLPTPNSSLTKTDTTKFSFGSSQSSDSGFQSALKSTALSLGLKPQPVPVNITPSITAETTNAATQSVKSPTFSFGLTPKTSSPIAKSDGSVGSFVYSKASSPMTTVTKPSEPNTTSFSFMKKDTPPPRQPASNSSSIFGPISSSASPNADATRVTATSSVAFSFGLSPSIVSSTANPNSSYPLSSPTTFSYPSPTTTSIESKKSSSTFSFDAAKSSPSNAFSFNATPGVFSFGAPKSQATSVFSPTGGSNTILPPIKTSTAATSGGMSFSFGSDSSNAFSAKKPAFSFQSASAVAPSMFSFGADDKTAAAPAPPSAVFPSVTSGLPASASSGPIFAFGKSQDKRNDTTFNFGQASKSPDASKMNFAFGSSAPSAAGIFQFQTPSTVPRPGPSETGSANPPLNKISTENRFSILSSQATPQQRVIKRAHRRMKN